MNAIMIQLLLYYTWKKKWIFFVKYHKLKIWTIKEMNLFINIWIVLIKENGIMIINSDILNHQIEKLNYKNQMLTTENQNFTNQNRHYRKDILTLRK